MIFGNSRTYAPLMMYGKNLTSVDRCKYLGVTVLAGKTFTVSETPFLRKFRCSMNTLLNVQQLSSEQILMKLLYTVCVPNLTYACDAISYNVRQTNAMTVALNDSIRRIFSYNRWESVTYLRNSFGYPSITEIFHSRNRIFQTRLSRTGNRTLCDLNAAIENL